MNKFSICRTECCRKKIVFATINCKLIEWHWQSNQSKWLGRRTPMTADLFFCFSFHFFFVLHSLYTSILLFFPLFTHCVCVYVCVDAMLMLKSDLGKSKTRVDSYIHTSLIRFFFLTRIYYCILFRWDFFSIFISFVIFDLQKNNNSITIFWHLLKITNIWDDFYYIHMY